MRLNGFYGFKCEQVLSVIKKKSNLCMRKKFCFVRLVFFNYEFGVTLVSHLGGGRT